jgi:lipopolysaccharide biosynthesis glycosyltransferase
MVQISKLNIVFTIDENYIQHFCVALTSLLENNNQIIGEIYLISELDNNTNLTKTLNFIQRKFNRLVICLKLNAKTFDKFKITHHISKATYFRLLLADILPSFVDTIIFIDSDIIVNGNIGKLQLLNFNVDAQNDEISAKNTFYIYAVNHQYEEADLMRLRKLGFKGKKYFNAGIMLINLKKWRDENISKKLIEYAKRYNEDLVWWDQDVLNLVFDDKWMELDFQFNAFGLTENNNSDYQIIHYTGLSKPWQFRNNHPFRKLYWNYLKRTPFYYSYLFNYFLSIARRIPANLKRRLSIIFSSLN